MLKKDRLIILLISPVIVFFSCETKMDNEAIKIVQKMTLKEKIGQMLMVGVPGKKTTKDSVAVINNYFPGGIILFGYNVGNAEEIKNYIRDMQRTAFTKYNIPLFVSIDQEGGRVKRIIDGITQFPGNMAFGVVDNKTMTYKAARILGIELRNLGINMNLAPVLDVNNNPSNPVINTRSFGSDVRIVSRLGASYIKGLQKSKCIAAGKHFPGHGDTDKDSHLTLPVINHDYSRLQKIEFPPFIKAIDNGVEAVMTAHISFPEIIKNDLPATISKRFLTDILRNKMQFNGIIITDDMEMNAISKIMDPGEAAVKSVQAGADIILISTHGKTIDNVSRSLLKAVGDGRISLDRINGSVKRIIELKLRYDIMCFKEGKIEYPEFHFTDNELKILKNAEEVNKRISREALYFYSSRHDHFKIVKDDESPKIFISSNGFFKNEIQANFLNHNKIICSEKDFTKNIIKNLFKESSEDMEFENTSVFLHFDNNYPESIEKIFNAIRKSGSKLYVLCTGNPFLLQSIKELPPVLFTFSNTNESIKQMTSCLKGEFKPKERINVNLGLAGK